MSEAMIMNGINNIYTLYHNDEKLECRLKGKKLKEDSRAYNPLAPGDNVVFEIDENHPGKGMIVSRVDRRNFFSRWNCKKRAPQILAANMDRVYCVASPDAPPFRPRFIDRVLAMSLFGGIPMTVVLNKTDKPVDEKTDSLLNFYSEYGLPVYRVSAETGAGIEALKEELQGHKSVLIGQSGVGKSTLINRLIPDAFQRTNEISDKYNRGRHTTNFSTYLTLENGGIVDTPGIRELYPWGITSDFLQTVFPELEPYIGHCRFKGCTHRTEPDCSIKQALAEGKILPDRYDSYLRLLHDTLEFNGNYEYRSYRSE